MCGWGICKLFSEVQYEECAQGVEGGSKKTKADRIQLKKKITELENAPQRMGGSCVQIDETPIKFKPSQLPETLKRGQNLTNSVVR